MILQAILLVAAFLLSGTGSLASAEATDPSGSGSYQAAPRDYGVPPCRCVGVRGPRGWSGPRGPKGKTGLRGRRGKTGLKGPTGNAGVRGATGNTGVAGATGNAGAQGPTGPIGAAGTTGPPGPIGPTGITGPAGPAGDDGATGATGPAGDDGATGVTGPAGADGVTGPIGATGSQGATGATGAVGAAAQSEFAYIYNLDSVPPVPINGAVPFSDNGPIGSAVVSHAPGTDTVTVNTPGVYEIGFSVSGVEPNQFTLFVNGVPVPGSTYGSGAGTQQNTGVTIVALSTADVVELRNFSSSAAVTLQTPAGGTEANVNASLTFLRLSS